jgi:hypothetical protein
MPTPHSFLHLSVRILLVRTFCIFLLITSSQAGFAQAAAEAQSRVVLLTHQAQCCRAQAWSYSREELLASLMTRGYSRLRA